MTDENQPTENVDPSEGGDGLMEAMGMEVPPSPKADAGGQENAATATLSTSRQDSHGTGSTGTESGTSDTSVSDDFNVAKAAELLEPDRPRQFYKCKKGHVTEDMWAHVARENEQGGEIIEDSGPICRICFVRWVRKMFPAKRCAPPKDVEKAA